MLVLAWLGGAAVAGPLTGQLSTVQTNDEATFLPRSAEATQVAALQQRFRAQDVLPAVVVIESERPLTESDRQAVASAAGRLQQLPEVSGTIVGPIPSQDALALELVVPLDANEAPDVSATVSTIRETIQSALPPSATAYVTGPAGFTADLATAFGGIDGILLLVAVLVVLVILVAVYRSPVLPVVVLLSTLFGLSTASALVYILAKNDTLTLNGQSQGILSILVVGAGTDYALLLTSRFREELREQPSSWHAMRVAWRQTAVPVVASAATVAAGLLCLLASDLNSTRSLGPIAALGILGALLSSMTFLPAALVLLGRSAFWPRPPRHGSPHPERAGVWGRVADFVTGPRRRVVWLSCTGVLVAFAALLPTLNASGTSQSDLFLRTVDSATGERAIARHFDESIGTPAVVIGPAGAAQTMLTTAARTPGVASASLIGEGGRPVQDGEEPWAVTGLVQLQATLEAPGDSEEAVDAVRSLRSAMHAAVPEARVGGPTAIQLDTQTTAERDRATVIPLVLAAILVLLILLLRSLLAPVLLLLSVVVSFAATLGISALVFNHLLGLPGADPSVPLYGFVFLVALGIDYNIFLMTRVREEAQRHGTRRGVHLGLRVTGGVITSAGIVLAATFSALGIIPLLFLVQIAFIVAFGVLLDTLVVRSVLVPALVSDVGPAVWWPRRLPADAPCPRPRTTSQTARARLERPAVPG
jgi:RND superfamily putative drug exporter